MPVLPVLQTSTGIAFDLASPKPAMISAVDLAVHLSRINRFCGATSWCEWSVAQHSLLTSIYVEESSTGDLATRTKEERDLIVAALLHDAAEAVCQDLPAPMRRAIVLATRCDCGYGTTSDPYEEVLRDVEIAIAAWADIDPNLFSCPTVRNADLRMLATERELFVARPWIKEWSDLPDPYVRVADLQAPPDIRIASSLAQPLDDGAPRNVLANASALRWMPLPPFQAAGQFMARLSELRPDLVENDPAARRPMPWTSWPKWADDVARAMQAAGVIS